MAIDLRVIYHYLDKTLADNEESNYLAMISCLWNGSITVQLIFLQWWIEAVWV